MIQSNSTTPMQARPRRQRTGSLEHAKLSLLSIMMLIQPLQATMGRMCVVRASRRSDGDSDTLLELTGCGAACLH